MASPVVEIKDVTKVFNTSRGLLTALQCVSFDVADGEFISLIGPSGCGKSTILRLVFDIHHPTSGKIIVTNESPYTARKDCRVNFMFQEPVLLPWRKMAGIGADG
jgi:NitT/TauT family transport system ATP-binding protein